MSGQKVISLLGQSKAMAALGELAAIVPARTELLGFVGRLEEVVTSDELMAGTSACLVGIDNLPENGGFQPSSTRCRQTPSPTKCSYKSRACWLCLHERFHSAGWRLLTFGECRGFKSPCRDPEDLGSGRRRKKKDRFLFPRIGFRRFLFPNYESPGVRTFIFQSTGWVFGCVEPKKTRQQDLGL
jgi:hypothetical protein